MEGAVASAGVRETGDRRAERERRSLELVRQSLQGLRYGTVTVVVQDGVAVQVERHEKIRVSPAGGAFREGEGI